LWKLAARKQPSREIILICESPRRPLRLQQQRRPRPAAERQSFSISRQRAARFLLQFNSEPSAAP
jgi:hypothetical protein